MKLFLHLFFLSLQGPGKWGSRIQKGSSKMILKIVIWKLWQNCVFDKVLVAFSLVRLLTTKVDGIMADFRQRVNCSYPFGLLLAIVCRTNTRKNSPTPLVRKNFGSNLCSSRHDNEWHENLARFGYKLNMKVIKKYISPSKFLANYLNHV